MTEAQEQSARATCARFNVPFEREKWDSYGEYIGQTFNGALGKIFIGIEKDGYAHS